MAEYARVISRNPWLSVSSKSPANGWAREFLLDEAFGPARFAETPERLRAGRMPAPGLSLGLFRGESADDAAYYEP